ncbi:MAG: type I-E CRISPR-associated protein Cas6/Cse3/CasE [Puniceicoccales bacterium]|jgi:CRISPR-associated protein Cas6/Cse3/CasE subtype I-E|nr:type I-E CRISPR-associated protein Cas6/Cse3/CasE [Puniceicoccales bacterium]
MKLLKIELPARDVHRTVRSCDDWHRLLWQGFGHGHESRRFLFRVNCGDGTVQILLRCPKDWSFFPKLLKCPVLAFGEKEIPDLFWNHPCHIFSLRAEPSICRSVGDPQKRGRRCYLWREEECRQWLENRSSDGIFRFLKKSIAVDRLADSCPMARRGVGSSKCLWWRRMTDFSGLLTVEDGTKFKKLCAAGIGCEKNYGCGLLLLRPVSEKNMQNFGKESQ